MTCVSKAQQYTYTVQLHKVLCRLTGVVGVKDASGTIVLTKPDISSSGRVSVTSATPSNAVHVVAGTSDRSPLMCAAYQGRLEVVNQLLSQGADVLARSNKASRLLVVHACLHDCFVLSVMTATISCQS